MTTGVEWRVAGASVRDTKLVSAWLGLHVRVRVSVTVLGHETLGAEDTHAQKRSRSLALEGFAGAACCLGDLYWVHGYRWGIRVVSPLAEGVAETLAVALNSVCGREV